MDLEWLTPGWRMVLLIAVSIALAYALFSRKKKKTYDNVSDHLNAIKGKASIESGFLYATVDRYTIDAITERIKSLTEQMLSVVNLESVAATAPFQIQRAGYDAQYLTALSKHTLDHVNVVQDINHQLFVAESDNILAAFRAATDLALPGDSYAKVAELAAMDNIRLRTRWLEKQQDLQAAFIVKNSDFQLLHMLLNYLKSLYVIVETETGRARERTEEHIKFMEGVINERQRLLQASCRSNVSGMDADSDG